jgi:hypothetical protein
LVARVYSYAQYDEEENNIVVVGTADDETTINKFSKKQCQILLIIIENLLSLYDENKFHNKLKSNLIENLLFPRPSIP